MNDPLSKSMRQKLQAALPAGICSDLSLEQLRQLKQDDLFSFLYAMLKISGDQEQRITALEAAVKAL